MPPEILDIVQRLIDCLTLYRLSSSRLDADVVNQAATVLQKLGRDLQEPYARWQAKATATNPAFEAAAVRDVIERLAFLRSVAANHLCVAIHLIGIRTEVEAYIGHGLLFLPAGQRILAMLEYNRHLIRQVENWQPAVKSAAAVIDVAQANSGRNLLLTLLDGLCRLCRVDGELVKAVTDFEEKAVSSRGAFQRWSDPLSIISPCGTPPHHLGAQRLDCIAVYRGLHFRRDYFSQLSVLYQQLAFLDHVPTYSAAARHEAKVDPGLVEVPANRQALADAAQQIEEILLQTKNQTMKPPWAKVAGNRFYSLLQRYINVYGNFEAELEAGDSELYRGLGFTQTPFVSFSFNPVHSIRYALGVKTPHTQSDQRVRQGALGELYVYLIPLTPENASRMNNILALQKEEKLTIKTRILNEAEVTVLGGMQSSFLVGRLIVGCSGWEFYDNLAKSNPESAQVLKPAKLKHWEQELAAVAVGTAVTEAAALGWTILGYEGAPDITREDVANAEFGRSSQPYGKSRKLFSKEELAAMRDEIARTEKIIEMLKELTAQKTGAARTLSFSSGTNALSVPRTVADFLLQQNVTNADASLNQLFEQFTEGQATPENNNCLIHTLLSNPNVHPDFEAIRKKLGVPRLPDGTYPHIGLTEAQPLAEELGLHVTVLALGHGGAVQFVGNIGSEGGKEVVLLHFGAHFVPLWAKTSIEIQL